MSKTDYKEEFLQQLGLVKITVQPEFVFAPPRKFRADWRVVDTRILIEFEGGLFKREKGGHHSVQGVLRDIEKYNTAALQGWIVIRITPKHVVSGEALGWVIDAVETSRANTLPE